MLQYHDLLKRILAEGQQVGDRTGTGTISIFGPQMKFDLKEGFPLLTTKFTPFRLVLSELLWLIKGNPNINYLHAHGNHIWDEWVKKDGTFGPIYGSQWRSWPSLEEEMVVKQSLAFGAPIVKGFKREIDQLQNVIDRLKSDPHGRRHVVSAWNVADVESGEMALPPCHVMFQFYARKLTQPERTDAHGTPCQQTLAGSKDPDAVLDGLGAPKYGLSCKLYQRSADMFLGVPFNIASYATLTHMIAHLTNMVPDKFIWSGGDTHIYLNHFGQVHELLGRDPDKFALPKLIINRDVDNIDDFVMDDFEVQGYLSYPAIKAPVSV